MIIKLMHFWNKMKKTAHKWPYGPFQSNIIDIQRNAKGKSQLHPVFPSGHPSKY